MKPKITVDRPTISMNSRYFTLDECAFLLRKTPRQVQSMVNKGELTSMVRRDETAPILIHSSQIDRILFPWQHIVRVDQRIDALHKLIEALKERINAQELAERVNMLDANVARLSDDLDELQKIVAELVEVRTRPQQIAPARRGLLRFFKRVFGSDNG